MNDKPISLSVSQLAEKADVSEVTIYRHIRKGAIRAFKQGPRAVRILKEEADRYLGVPQTPGKNF